MDIQDIASIGALVIGFTSLLTSFFLQRDVRKIRDLQRDNKKYRGRLLKALNAIKGYQAIEAEYADKEGIDVKTYRARIRKDKQELFNTSFLSPSNVDEMMKDLENN